MWVEVVDDAVAAVAEQNMAKGLGQAEERRLGCRLLVYLAKDLHKDTNMLLHV